MITSHEQIMPQNQSWNMQKFASPVIALNNFHMGRNQSTPTSSSGIMIKSQHIWGGHNVSIWGSCVDTHCFPQSAH